MIKNSLTILLILLIFGCQIEDESTDLRVRVVFEAINSGELSSKVYLEGDDGQAVNGAMVYILSPSNIMTLLDFDYGVGCYTADLGFPEDGEYEIIVNSVAYETVNQLIPFKTLGSELSITILQDSMGNNALIGQTLDINNSFSFSWEAIEDITAYIVTLNKPDGTNYSLTTIDNTVLIDSEDMDLIGNYSINIKAQYISGDPLFINNNYYAVNELESSRYYFNAQ